MKVGSKQDHLTRFQLPNGFKKFLITCVADLDCLLMNNRVFCGEIAQGIAVAKR